MSAALEDQLRIAREQVAELHLLLERSVQRSNALVIETELSNLLLQEIFDASHDAIWVLDRELRVVRVNLQMAALVGRTPGELVGMSCAQVLRSSACATPACPAARLLGGNGAAAPQDVEVEAAGGARLCCSLSASICRDPCAEVLGIVETFTDITARKQAERALQEANAELARLSRTDGLTGLANRRHLDERLEVEWRRLRRERQPIGLLLADVDFFKRYNDSCGHQAGDRCLAAVAAAIQAAVLRPADLAARYGGEEFAVVLPGTDLEGTRLVGERVRSAVERLALPHPASAAASLVTLSLGAASLVPGDGPPAELTALADAALYRAKERGRNRVEAHAPPPAAMARGAQGPAPLPA